MSIVDRVFRIGKIGYYLDFVLAPLALLALAFWAGATRRGPGFLLGVVPGFVLWTLLEYLIHRFVFHGLGFTKEHAYHHVHPEDYVGVVSWVSAPSFALASALLIILLGSFGIGMAAGLIAGYLAYIIVHDQFHHGRTPTPGSWMWTRLERHLAHHRGVGGNYGVTTSWWDKVWGTLRLDRRD